MEIQLAASQLHTIQSYSDKTLTINGCSYTGSLILSREEIISSIDIYGLSDITEDYITLSMKYHPKIVLFGHNKTDVFLPHDKFNNLYEQGIGVECMSIGAACRTYNILLEEGREVVAGFFLDEPNKHATL